jgi:hypothetical protein
MQLVLHSPVVAEHFCTDANAETVQGSLVTPLHLEVIDDLQIVMGKAESHTWSCCLGNELQSWYMQMLQLCHPVSGSQWPISSTWA